MIEVDWRYFASKKCPTTGCTVGLMGMEALETVIGYWEDALAAYNPTGNLPSQITITISHPTILKDLLNNVVEPE